MNGSLKITLGILGVAVLFGGSLMTGCFWPKTSPDSLPTPEHARGKRVASPRIDAQESATKPRYRATTVFQINQISAPEVIVDGSGGVTTGSNVFEAQVKTVTSRDTLMLAVRNLKLETKWKLRPGEAARKLERLTKVEQEHGTDIISLSAWSDNAEEAVTIANGLRDAYAQRRQQFEAERMSRLTQIVTEQTKLQEAAVEQRRLELLELMKKHNIVDRSPPNPNEAPQPSETPSDADIAAFEAEQQKQSGYATRHYRYESQVQLLNDMREHAGKFTQEAVTSNSIEILDTAVAVEYP